MTPTMSATHRSQLRAEFSPPKIARMTAMTMMMMRARFMEGSPSVAGIVRGVARPGCLVGTRYDDWHPARWTGRGLTTRRSAVLRAVHPAAKTGGYRRRPDVSTPSVARACRSYRRANAKVPKTKEDDHAEGRGSGSLKDRELYEELRNEGASKEKAARISNAVERDGREAVGHRGGKAGDYEDWTVEQLRERAKELGLSGYSGKRKAELISMLRNH